MSCSIRPVHFPPIQAYDSIEVYDVYDASCGARKVDFDLWFDNEKSDLTVSMEVRVDVLGKLGLIIEDIHFLWLFILPGGVSEFWKSIVLFLAPAHYVSTIAVKPIPRKYVPARHYTVLSLPVKLSYYRNYDNYGK